MKEKSDLKSIFAKNLKTRRKRLGLTQAELAKQINVSTSFITEIENGRKAPSFSTIEKLSSILKAPCWSFFCEYGDKIDLNFEDKEKFSFQLKNEINNAIDEFLNNNL